MFALDTTLYDSGFYKTALIKPNINVSVPQNDVDVFYRLRYADYVGYDLTIKWVGNGTVIPYIADTCLYTFSTTSPRLVLKPAPTIQRLGTYTITSAILDTWASRVDSNGYLYVRFKAILAGKIIFQTEKPAE
jgi:hypothetical protein